MSGHLIKAHLQPRRCCMVLFQLAFRRSIAWIVSLVRVVPSCNSGQLEVEGGWGFAGWPSFMCTTPSHL